MTQLNGNRNGHLGAVPDAASLFSADFDELRGGERHVSRGRTIVEADLVSFAALTGDWHPQHVDAEWAAGSAFGERVAHGMMVLSYSVGLLPLDPERILALRRVGDVTFKRPVRLDDTIYVESRVEQLRSLDERTGLVGCRWRIVNQHGELVAQATVDVLWRRGEPGTSQVADGADGRVAGEAVRAAFPAPRTEDSLPLGVLPL